MTQPKINTLINVSPDSAAMERWDDNFFSLSVLLLADKFCEVVGVNGMEVDVGCDIKLTFLCIFVASLKKRRWRDEIHVNIRTSIVRKRWLCFILKCGFWFLERLEKYLVATEYDFLIEFFLWSFLIMTNTFMLPTYHSSCD